jgi:micrococcal nuclease
MGCVCSCAEEYLERKVLKECTKENTPKLTLDDVILQSKIVDVYDADTVTVAFRYNKTVYQSKCRLVGIDAAEIRTKNLEEKKVGIAGRDRMKELCEGRILWVHYQGWGKYGGRLLGTLYRNKKGGHSLNQQMIDENYAYKYDGGKKRKFEEWYKNY